MERTKEESFKSYFSPSTSTVSLHLHQTDLLICINMQGIVLIFSSFLKARWHRAIVSQMMRLTSTWSFKK